MAVFQYTAPGINAFNASTVGGTSVAVQMFPAVANNFTSGVAPVAYPCILPIPANGQFEQQQFTVIASGKFFVHGTSPTQIWKMFNGTSTAVGSNGTALLTMSALSGLTTNNWYPWTWESKFQGDTSSGVLQAISSSLWVNNATAGTITLTGATGVNFTTYGSVNLVGPGYTQTSQYSTNALNLCIGFQQTVADALNKCYLTQFGVV